MSDVVKYTWSSVGMVSEEQLPEKPWGKDRVYSKRKSNWVKIEDFERLQSAHDKLKEMVEGADKYWIDDFDGFYLSRQGAIDGGAKTPKYVAIVGLTPEEIEGDEPHSLENPKESVQRD